MELLLWKAKNNTSSWYRDIKEIRVSIVLLPPYFDRLMKWNPVMKVWKKLELMSMRHEGKCCVLRVSISGCYPLFWSSHEMKPCYEGFERKLELMSMRYRRKMLDFGASIGLLPLILIRLMKWNPVMKVWKKSELMSMRYEGKCWVLE